MKNRLSVLGFATLLLMGTWGTSHALPPSAGPADPGDTVAAPSDTGAPGAAPFCPASVAGLPRLDLTQSPSPESFPCGACSYWSCQDERPSSSCYYLNGSVFSLGRCIITSVCEEDNSSSCDCLPV
jgi:hypothetical protein